MPKTRIKTAAQPRIDSITEVYVDKHEESFWLVSIVYEAPNGPQKITGPDGDNKILVYSQKEVSGIVRAVEMLTGQLFIAKPTEHEKIVRYRPM